MLSEALGIELRRSHNDSFFRHFIRQLDAAALGSAISDWGSSRNRSGEADLDLLICDAHRLNPRADSKHQHGFASGMHWPGHSL